MSPAPEITDALLTTKQRLASVREAVAVAAEAVGRAAGDVTLIAVSKTQPAEAIIEAIEAGQVDFGENRVQEAMEKWPALKQQYPHIRLHLLGNLQRNKLRDALGLFDAFHTVDRPKLAAGMARLRDEEDMALPLCFVQVNTGEEPQKAGVGPRDVDGFVAEGSGENLFVINNGVIYTPELTSALDGITRQTLMKMAAQIGVEVREKRITRDEVYTADEAFFTGTAAEVTPIRELDNRAIGEGKRGPITEQLQTMYFDLVHGRLHGHDDWLDYV